MDKTTMNYQPITINHLRWGIIGCGRIAHRFVQGLNEVPGTELVSVWSRRTETVNSFVQQFGGNACASVEELLLSNIDIVYIAT
jgi:predicted dehydrogenase